MENSGKSRQQIKKKHMEPSPWMDPPEKHVRNPKTVIFPHKKNI